MFRVSRSLLLQPCYSFPYLFWNTCLPYQNHNVDDTSSWIFLWVPRIVVGSISLYPKHLSIVLMWIKSNRQWLPICTLTAQPMIQRPYKKVCAINYLLYSTWPGIWLFYISEFAELLYNCFDALVQPSCVLKHVQLPRFDSMPVAAFTS
jgi:hypothetical protein